MRGSNAHARFLESYPWAPLKLKVTNSTFKKMVTSLSEILDNNTGKLYNPHHLNDHPESDWKKASPFLLTICKRPAEASILSVICLSNWHSRWLVASIDDTSVVRIVRSCAKPTHSGPVGHSLVSKQTWPIVNSECLRGRNKRPKMYIFANVCLKTSR